MLEKVYKSSSQEFVKVVEYNLFKEKALDQEYNLLLFKKLDKEFESLKTLEKMLM